MNFLDEVSSLKQLRYSWQQVSKKKHVTQGIDPDNFDDFSKHSEKYLAEISKSLKNKSYKLHAVLERKIPKSRGKFRTIYKYILRDRIVEKSIQITLQRKRNGKSLFPEINNKVSIGYIPKQGKSDVVGVKKAVQSIKSLVKNDYFYITVCDIADFFDVLNRDILRKKLFTAFKGDNSINWLIEQSLNPDIVKLSAYGDPKELPPKDSGVLQGSVLAPLYSNIYMGNFDNALIKEKIPGIRYADDLAIFSKDIDSAQKDLIKAADLLNIKASLEFHPSGTSKGPKHYDVRNQVFFLGLEFVKQDRLRWMISPESKKVKAVKTKIGEIVLSDDYTFSEKINRLNNSLSSWYWTYLNCGCSKKQLNRIFSGVEDYYKEEIIYILKLKKIITKPLNKDQLEFLGVSVSR